MKYHLTPVRTAIVNKSTNNKCWRGCGAKGTLLYCRWVRKLVQSLQRTVCRFLKKLETELLYDPPSLVAQKVKNLSAMWDTQVQFLGQEDPLEKGMATHSSIIAWGIPWTEKPGGLQSTGSQRVGHGWATKHSTLIKSDPYVYPRRSDPCGR